MADINTASATPGVQGADENDTSTRSDSIGGASLAVIVPVRNEERSIGDTLTQLLAQERSEIQLEILVIDGRSTDCTREIVQRIADKHPLVRLLDNPDKLSSAARNVGVRESTGKYLVIIDGHCEIPTRTYFVDLVEAFERSGADCLGRPQSLDVANGTVLQRAVAAARSSPIGHHPDSFIYTDEELDVPAISVAVAYRRNVFDRVGVFDETFDACEDCEFNHRVDAADLRCRFAPPLAVKYHPRATLTGLFRQLSRYGRGRIRLFRKHPQSFSVSTLLPTLFWLGVVIGPLLCLAMPGLWVVYSAVVAIYFAAVLIMSVWSTLQHSQSPWVLACMPAVLVTLHLGCAWGVVYECFVGWLPGCARCSGTKPGAPSGC